MKKRKKFLFDPNILWYPIARVHHNRHTMIARGIVAEVCHSWYRAVSLPQAVRLIHQDAEKFAGKFFMSICGKTRWWSLSIPRWLSIQRNKAVWCIRDIHTENNRRKEFIHLSLSLSNAPPTHFDAPPTDAGWESRAAQGSIRQACSTGQSGQRPQVASDSPGKTGGRPYVAQSRLVAARSTGLAGMRPGDRAHDQKGRRKDEVPTRKETHAHT